MSKVGLRRVTIIEARVLAGELLLYALRQSAPDLSIDLVESLDAVDPGNPSILFYSFVNRDCDLVATDKALTRLLAPGFPLVIVTDTASAELGALMRHHGVENWVPASAGFNALVAAVRVATTAAYVPRLELGPPMLLPEGPAVHSSSLEKEPLGLTAREHVILRLLHEGKGNKIIAYELGCSESTVKVHISNMMRKLRLHNRTQLALVYKHEAPGPRPIGAHPLDRARLSSAAG